MMPRISWMRCIRWTRRNMRKLAMLILSWWHLEIKNQLISHFCNLYWTALTTPLVDSSLHPPIFRRRSPKRCCVPVVSMVSSKCGAQLLPSSETCCDACSFGVPDFMLLRNRWLPLPLLLPQLRYRLLTELRVKKKSRPFIMMKTRTRRKRKIVWFQHNPIPLFFVKS
jgi:hypothetical protein